MFRHKHAVKPFSLVRVGPTGEETTISTFASRAKANRTLTHYRTTDAEGRLLAALEGREPQAFTYRVDEVRRAEGGRP